MTEGPLGCVRAFVAVLPSEAASRELGRLLDRLRPLARIRWVTQAQLHITLRFLGEIPLDTAVRVRNALLPMAFDPFDLELSHAGAFPDISRPRALWLAGGRGARELMDLASRVEDALTGVGIPRETRPFKLHLTLARARGAPLPPALLRELDHVQPISWRCGGIQLMRSVLAPGGAIYSKLELPCI